MLAALAGLGVLLALLLFPGVYLVRRQEWESEDAFEILATAFLTSAAFWACALWLLPGGWFSSAANAVVALGALALPLLRGRLAAVAGRRPRDTAVLLGLLAVCLVARALLVVSRPPPSGGDLTKHAYMAELILLADGLPSSHEPLLPISSFGQYSPGLHALAALVRAGSGLPPDAAALLVGGVSLVLVALALDRVVGGLAPDVPRLARGLGALLLLLFARNPQGYVAWGGHPTTLATALAFFVAAEMPALVGPRDAIRAARLGMVAAGVALTHLIPVVTAAYVLPVLAAWHLARARPVLRPAVANAAVAGLVGLGLMLPYAVLAARTPRPDVLDWARAWIRGEMDQGGFLAMLPLGPSRRYYAAFPFCVYVFVGLGPILVTTAWIVQAVRRRRAAAVPALLVIGAVAVLHLAPIGEFLPLWRVLYPSRTALFLLVPAALAGAHLLAGLAARPRLAWGAAAVLGAAALVQGIPPPSGAGSGDAGLGWSAFWHTYRDRTHHAVGPDDLAVIEWIRDHTPPAAVIGTNGHDGGPLIPALAHRKVTRPHYPFFWYRPEFEAWLSQARPDYIFVGTRPTNRSRPEFTATDLDRRADVTLVVARGAARLYRVHR